MAVGVAEAGKSLVLFGVGRVSRFKKGLKRSRPAGVGQLWCRVVGTCRQVSGQPAVCRWTLGGAEPAGSRFA